MMPVSQRGSEKWPRKRLKFVATYNDDILPEDTDDFEEINYVEISGVSLTGGIEETSRIYFHEAPSRARRKVRSGDVLISTVRTYLKAIAAVPQAEANLIASTGFCVIRPGDEMDSTFLGWVAKSEPFVSEIVARSVGVSYPAINASELATLEVPLPSFDTQRRIAKFLNEKTARIDALIAKKQALLDRMGEKRQALITRAVTKGLNPTAPMKDSGIDWLGEIPAHWKVIRLHFLTSEPLKYGANAPADFDNPDWPRFVRISDVDENGQLRPDTFRSQPQEVAEPYMLQEQDILLARSGATVGKSFIYRSSWGSGCFAGYLIRARLLSEVSSEFVYRFLNSSAYWEWVRANFIQSTIQNISAEKYGNLWIALPSERHEQDQISRFLDSACEQIDQQLAKICASLDKLAEYRAALITAAVTGRLKLEAV
ncbi:MAG: restriction endonuclease subunit S [Methylocella sp.]